MKWTKGIQRDQCKERLYIELLFLIHANISAHVKFYKPTPPSRQNVDTRSFFWHMSNFKYLRHPRQRFDPRQFLWSYATHATYFKISPHTNFLIQAIFYERMPPISIFRLTPFFLNRSKTFWTHAKSSIHAIYEQTYPRHSRYLDSAEAISLLHAYKSYLIKLTMFLCYKVFLS